MGLDMYLDQRRFTSKYFEPETFEQLAPLHPSTQDYVKISFNVAYWRKANAIHKWFVDNVQGGEDECREHYVSREQLTELRDLCRYLLTRKDPKEAAERLPTTSGFFFGSTEYDKYYWQYLQDTVDQLDPLLFEQDNFDDFIYCSSW